MLLNEKISLVCSQDDFSGVVKIANLVADDLRKKVALSVELTSNEDFTSQSENQIIFGTLGKSPKIEKIAGECKIDLSKLTGKSEVYAFYVDDKKIVIIGSDKRGTIYGLFHISELLGISPLVNWNCIPVKQEKTFEIANQNLISKEPSVRFRGFFINDEWPACGNWSKKNFGGFNAQMYEQVFELLLRMKGNYLWPAMWSARFSDDGPGLANAELADELGVIMGASHHEPCCRAGEEYKYLRGPNSPYGDAWNFIKNKDGITKFWEDGLKRSGKFENVITVGMRGEADTAIMQNATLADNINLLRDVLKTQNNLIRQYVNPDLQKVPRMLALYKEVEPYFYGDKKTPGLMDSPELEGVTLMLCDDNHGNLRTVPTEKMRSHNGGYGMYYHFDYHGSPYSFEWVNTTNLAKVKEQMCAAYEFGIRDLWIVNVGDIMTNELPLNYFLDLAFDYERFSIDESPVLDYINNWIRQTFPTLTEEQKGDIEFIIKEYTKIAHTRRTESLQPETYHPINFCESDMMISRANKVIEKAEKLKSEISSDVMPSFMMQVYFPACGNMNVLRMQLYSGKNKWFAKHGAVAANYYAKKIKECYDFDKTLVDEVDQIADGKFYASGWSEHFGFTNWCEAASAYPTYTYVEPTRKGRLLFWVDGCEITTTGQDWTNRVLRFDGFKNPEVNEFRLNIANCGKSVTPYSISFKNYDGDVDFLSGQIEKSEIVDENGVCQKESIIVKIDREKMAKYPQKVAGLIIEAEDGNGANIQVLVEIDATPVNCDYPKGTFVQTTSYISMEAEHRITTSSSVTEAFWRTLPDYGKTLSAIKVIPVTQTYKNGKNAPFAEYHFVPSFADGEKSGVMAFDFYLNPSNPAYKDNKLQFMIEVNGEKILKDVVEKNFAVGDNQEPWSTDVTNNIRISTVFAECKAGLNVLKIYPVTPNIVLEKIVIHEANKKMPDSYLGAPETYFIR